MMRLARSSTLAWLAVTASSLAHVRPVQPLLDPGRVAAPQPPRHPVGAGEDRRPAVRGARDRGVRRQPRHGRRRRRPGGTGAPADCCPAGRRAGCLLRNRLRLQRPREGADRARGPVRRTGRQQLRYADYPALAKVVSQGIALHEGRRFGTLTMCLTTAFCLGVIASCVTGPLMWWRRRPRGTGQLGAPRGGVALRSSPLPAAGIVALAFFLPVFGASLLVVLLLDRFVLRRLARSVLTPGVRAPKP